MAGLSSPPSFYITNVVGCRPTQSKEGPNRPPQKDEAQACFSRVEQIAELVQPKRVVLLGAVAQRWCRKLFPEAVVLVHPAYILRWGSAGAAIYRPFLRGLVETFRSLTHE